MPASLSSAATPRPAIEKIEGSLIREVSECAAGVPDVIGLWFGEPDRVTPSFIREAAKASLDQGETFYTSNVGRSDLREEIVRYNARLGRGEIALERVCVTASGMQGLHLACEMLLSPGDRVVIPSPVWPNLAGVAQLCGAEVISPLLQFDNGEWQTDLDALIDALTPDTRMVMLNSPANPTGWMLTREQQQVILDHCRRHQIWIIADDVYERLVFDQPVAPAFLDIATPKDRLISVNSCSKSWAMTGWRLGWIIAPLGFEQALAKINEFEISCASSFVQAGAIAALRDGEAFLADTVRRYRIARDYAADALGSVPGLVVPRARGGMYAFFSVEGCTDSLGLAKKLVHKAHVGLAPGRAFGQSGEGYMRLCFAVSPELLAKACERIATYLYQHGPN